MTIASVFVAFAAVLSGCAASPPASLDLGRSAPVSASIDTLALLREGADHEALLTMAGGLKPMSTGMWQGSFDLDSPDLGEIQAVRAALKPLCNETWYADVQVFASSHEGERFAHAFVVHRRAMARTIERFAGYWSPWGITPCTHPAEVVAVVDRMPKGERWRGYGYLFGMPVDAVDFFVESGLAAKSDEDVGPGRDRQFIQIATYAAETGRFAYAVPLDHVRTAADEALAEEAARILLAYSGRRERMGDAATMVHELLELNRTFEGSATRASKVRDRHYRQMPAVNEG